MGSPVSVVVAEIVMQNIEEQALATYNETLPLWLRYVDDTITAVHEKKIDEFHEHLNKQNTNIQSTKEIEENGKTPLHTNPFSLYDAYSLTLREKTNQKTKQEQFIRSTAPTARPLISVTPAET